MDIHLQYIYSSTSSSSKLGRHARAYKADVFLSLTLALALALSLSHTHRQELHAQSEEPSSALISQGYVTCRLLQAS